MGDGVVENNLAGDGGRADAGGDVGVGLMRVGAGEVERIAGVGDGLELIEVLGKLAVSCVVDQEKAGDVVQARRTGIAVGDLVGGEVLLELVRDVGAAGLRLGRGLAAGEQGRQCEQRGWAMTGWFHGCDPALCGRARQCTGGGAVDGSVVGWVAPRCMPRMCSSKTPGETAEGVSLRPFISSCDIGLSVSGFIATCGVRKISNSVLVLATSLR